MGKTHLLVLPDEVVLQICSNLSFNDIYTLCSANNQLFHKINRISKYILTEEVKKQNITTNDVYNFTQYFLELLYSKYNTPETVQYPYYIKNLIIRHFSNLSPCLLNLAEHIVTWFVFKKEIFSYDFPLILYMFYVLLNIEFLRNTKNVSYYVVVLSQFICSNPDMTEIAFNYFQFIIQNKIPMNVNIIHLVSKQAVSICLLKKLFGVKYLDLSHSKLVRCCLDCAEENIKEIVYYKYNKNRDLFLSFNYQEIKLFLKRENYPLYHKLERYEHLIVNKKISIPDPETNIMIKLSSFRAKKLLFQLKFEVPHHDECLVLERYIHHRQNILRKEYFS